MRYYCGDERRREVLKNLGTANGIDYLEVIDHDAPDNSLRQRTLVLRLLHAGATLNPSQVQIFGGERIKTIEVEWVAPATALPVGESPDLIEGLDPADEFTLVRTKQYGDYSLYNLRLVAAATDDAPPAGFDPRLSEVEFSFKVECESDVDCAPDCDCPVVPEAAPQINYLAKDYPTFRQLMFDRLSLIAPQWHERSPAGLGTTLVELLAYVADQLSYQQDAIATEAYIGTARSRISLRRHARLVDYRVHDGCNARAWVQVRTESDDAVPLPAATQLLTRAPGAADRLPPGSDALRDALNQSVEVFETVDDAVIYKTHERLVFYTWGERECCLPQGATGATLAGALPALKAGDVLVFVEEVGPNTGSPSDADPAHRCAVRLTDVRLSEDPSGGLFLDTPVDAPVAVTEVTWATEDALPFSVCISARLTDEEGDSYLDAVSTAYGNIVLADHGMTVVGEALGVVPTSRGRYARRGGACADDEPAKEIAPRFRPLLQRRPLTQAVQRRPEPLFTAPTNANLTAELDANSFGSHLEAWLQARDIVFEAGPVSLQGGDGTWSVSDGRKAYGLRIENASLGIYAQPPAATKTTAEDTLGAKAAARLTGELNGQLDDWFPQDDLLASAADAREFVAEAENDATVYLRLGDDTYGKRPDSGTSFSATYRVGNGVRGNVGAQSIAHIVSSDGRLTGVTNLLPAKGGVDPESAEAIRRDAPEAFRTQERAVTAEDYALVTKRYEGVQRAAASFRWTGSWQTVFVTADQEGSAEVTPEFEGGLVRHLDRFRMAGYDLEVDAPQFVALELEIDVCVKPDYFRAHVRESLQRAFSSGWLADGRRAFFHPDNFSFREAVYLSAVYATAMAIEGVESVVVKVFQRLHAPDPKPLEDGVLRLDRLEIARLDNDPSFPDRGLFRLNLDGGK